MSRIVHGLSAGLAAVLLLSGTAVAQQTGGAAGTAQGNQAVQGTETQATQVTGQGVQIGGLADSGGLQSFFSGADVSSIFSVAGAQQGGGRGSTRQFNVAGGQAGSGRTGGTSATTRQVRPRFRLAFQPSRSLTAARVQASAVSRLTKYSGRVPALKNVAVEAAANGTITLRGTVNSPDAARLASNLLRLEPGVRRIQNEIKVAASESPAPPAPPALPAAPAG